MAIKAETPISLNKFKGINNQKPIHELSADELVQALNVDLTDEGGIKTRSGFSSVYSGNCRSLYGSPSDSICLFIEGSQLKRRQRDRTTILLKSNLDPLTRFSFEEINGSIYFSNGLDGGIIDNITETSQNVRPWGLTVPTSPPVLTETKGSLFSGVYNVVISFISPNSMESGTSLESSITLPDESGIEMTGIQSDVNAEFVQVYITDPNGEIFYRLVKLPNGTTTVKITNLLKKGASAGTNLFREQLPFGKHIAFHYGRLYVSDADILWYSEPYNFEICDMRKNFIQMNGEITMLASMKEGLFVSDTKTHFIAVKGATKDAILTTKLEYPAIPYTLSTIEKEFNSNETSGADMVMWNSSKGIIRGDALGNIENLTGRDILGVETSEGASLFRQKNGLNQYIVMGKQTRGAASNLGINDQLGLEIRRGNVII